MGAAVEGEIRRIGEAATKKDSAVGFGDERPQDGKFLERNGEGLDIRVAGTVRRDLFTRRLRPCLPVGGTYQEAPYLG
jgi:hypothetical protein